MSPAAPSRSTVSLRAVTQYLSSTPYERLPFTIPPIANTLSSCRDLLSSSDNSLAKDRSETAVLVHKFKTQVSTLLQGRTIEERWAAVVLIKTTVEAGGWEVLSDGGTWVRGMLGILGKPDPPTTKKLCITALTRIFFLTQEHQTLVRELTTPSLPVFISSCINLIASKGSSSGTRQLNIFSPLLFTVLESFNRLLPRHCTLFRPSRTQIHALLLPLIAPTPSTSVPNTHLSLANASQVKHAAQCLFVRLHYCAPKNNSAEEWKKEFEIAIRNTHTVADQVFRAVIEDWEPTTEALSRKADPRTYGDVVSDAGNDLMHLPAWSGIQAGVERLIGTLDLLAMFVCIPSSPCISIRIDYVMDLLTRIFAITVPPDHQVGVRLNQEIGREEREAFWSSLPNVHIAAMDVLLSVIRRLDKAFIPMAQGSLDQLVWVFRAENWSVDLRTSTYTVVRELFKLAGPSLSKSVLLTGVIQSCCEDLLLSSTTPEQATSSLGPKDGKSAPKGTSSANADSYLKSSVEPPSVRSVGLPGLIAAASDLLPHLLLDLPANFLSFPLRSRIDRTAVLIQHNKAMLASVLNPPLVKSGGKPVNSILPFLARSNHSQLEAEGILRPRMPIINARSIVGDDIYSDTEDELRVEEGNRLQPVETRPYTSILDASAAPAVATNTEVETSVVDVTHDPRSPVAIEAQPPLVTTASTKPAKRDHDTFTLASDHTQLASTSESLPTKRVRANAPESLTSTFEEAIQDAPRVVGSESLTRTGNSDLVHEAAILPPIQAPVPAGKPLMGDAVGDSDEDMEIPPLTMDPDTEDEDESELDVDGIEDA
ncbi:MAG: hypothetical protein M1812_006754 [Candelaria pacifica]|nr:MAG: hypothetical protein M1812_006754 [Candelaria pacifica]